MLKTVLPAALALLAPAAAFAHGGHPEAGEFHALAHVLWFGLPAGAVLGFLGRGRVPAPWRKKSRPE